MSWDGQLAKRCVFVGKAGFYSFLRPSLPPTFTLCDLEGTPGIETTTVEPI